MSYFKDFLTGRTADATPDIDADYAITYDASVTTTKKVLLKNLVGTILATLRTVFTPASSSGPASLQFHEDTDNGTNKVTLKAPASVASDVDVVLPDTAGTLALQSYVDAAVVGLLDDKGNQDCSGNPNYPAASKGDIYTVSVAGKIGGASGITVEVGDAFRALADNAGGTQAGVGTSWAVVQANLVGALISGGALGTPSSGTLTNCTGLPLAGVAGISRFVKSADTIRNDGNTADTPTVDPHLAAITFEANKTYRVEMMLRYTDGGSGGFQCQFDRASGTAVASSFVEYVARDVAHPIATVAMAMGNLTDTFDPGSLGPDIILQFTATVVAGASNGIYQLLWAQSVSDSGDVTLLKGGNIVVTKLD